MKKYFYILTMAGCLSLINGINNANAVQSEAVLVTYTCPAGCELNFGHGSDGKTYAYCRTPGGEDCDDPSVNIVVLPDNAISPATPVVKPTDLKPNKMDKVNAKKVSARSAETPRMVKKIVYEQIVEEDEE